MDSLRQNVCRVDEGMGGFECKTLPFGLDGVPKVPELLSWHGSDESDDSSELVHGLVGIDGVFL
jgi:hypothetical protein